MQDSKEIRKATPMFSGSGNSMALSGSLHLETGSKKFKMAAAKPEVPVSQLLSEIAKKVQRLRWLPDVPGVGKVNCTIKKVLCRNLK